MRPNSSSAIFTSLILHGFVAAVIFVTTVYLVRSEKVAPAIIELVAGPPTDPGALEAPALGNTPNPVKVTVPQVELPAEPQQPEPQAQETPSVPEPTPAPSKPIPKPEPAKVTKSDTSMAKQMKQQAKTSYKDFLKKNPIKPQVPVTNAGRKTASGPRVDVQGIAQGVRGGSTASTKGGGGKAMSREEADQLTVYQSFLIQELKRAHEPPPGVSDQLQTKVTFDITASGAILNPRISKSSGNRDFDDSVLEAFRRMRSIGPTPDRRPHTWTVTFKMDDNA